MWIMLNDEKVLIYKCVVLFWFVKDRVVHYKCQYVKDERLYTDYMGDKGRPKLKLDENFSKTVEEFSFFEFEVI